MPYRDTWTECTQCGKQFVFRVEEQRQLDSRGEEIVPPQQCPACSGKDFAPLQQSRSRSEPPRSPQSRRTKPPETPRPKTTEPLGHGPHEGEVKWFSAEKGYGFLVHPGGQEIFFHRSSLAPGEVEHVRDGMRVTFLVEETERGPQAIDVERLD
jgi:CspA family cold shock protein